MMAFAMTPMMQDAIERLTTSFRYDPPSRWHGAYEVLEPIRQHAGRLRKRIGPVSLIVAIAASLALAPWLGFDSDLAGPFWLTLWAAHFVARRLFPILETAEQIEDAHAYLTRVRSDEPE
jgi:hypothetical protein